MPPAPPAWRFALAAFPPPEESESAEAAGVAETTVTPEGSVTPEGIDTPEGKEMVMAEEVARRPARMAKNVAGPCMVAFVLGILFS